MQFACNESDKEQKLILEAIKICDEQNELINKESLIIAKTFERKNSYNSEIYLKEYQIMLLLDSTIFNLTEKFKRTYPNQKNGRYENDIKQLNSIISTNLKDVKFPKLNFIKYNNQKLKIDFPLTEFNSNIYKLSILNIINELAFFKYHYFKNIIDTFENNKDDIYKNKVKFTFYKKIINEGDTVYGNIGVQHIEYPQRVKHFKIDNQIFYDSTGRGQFKIKLTPKVLAKKQLEVSLIKPTSDSIHLGIKEVNIALPLKYNEK